MFFFKYFVLYLEKTERSSKGKQCMNSMFDNVYQYGKGCVREGMCVQD